MELIVAAHIVLGELGIVAMLWVVMEVVQGPSSVGVIRAKAASMIGTASFFAAWVVAGTYYVVTYGSTVKPVIKDGPWPWAHGVFMEAKEHIFLLLPFFAVVLASVIWMYGDELRDNRRARLTTYVLGGVAVLLGAAMAGMGYFVSSGYRYALSG